MQALVLMPPPPALRLVQEPPEEPATARNPRTRRDTWVRRLMRLAESAYREQMGRPTARFFDARGTIMLIWGEYPRELVLTVDLVGRRASAEVSGVPRSRPLREDWSNERIRTALVAVLKRQFEE